MGQTLSHGVYLPNEGERNCYAGLASNWQILNTAVGAIAEKAPLVHTHGNITNDGKVGTTANQPLITGTGGAITAGAFGNQANTFCEGNDSRLSDARTPVAHTHTKSDVTDLLNSDFIPSANNSYDLGSSSYQWKTLNGINPGALSLPSSDSADYIDLSDNLSTNAEYQYTAPYDGWLCLYVIVNEFYTENAAGLYRSDTSANSHQWAKSVTAALNLYKQNKYQGSVMLPVESGKKYICYISINANTTINRKHLFFYKNKGNV